MSIIIDAETCTGCGKCRTVCPGGLLGEDAAGKTVNHYPRDCWGCTACIKECNLGAIKYYLGADLGGRGTTLKTRYEGDYMHWVFSLPAGEEKVITVNRKEANKY